MFVLKNSWVHPLSLPVAIPPRAFMDKKLDLAFAQLANRFPLEEHYTWPVPQGCPIPIPEDQQGAFRRNLYLKENLRSVLEDDQDYRVRLWIIQEWGGIKSFKNKESNRERMDQLDGQLAKRRMDKRLFGVISSLSKIAAFKEPETYSIYDSRVIFALNWLLFSNTENPRLFRLPLGRNAALTEFDSFTLYKLSGRSFTMVPDETAYFEYCELLCGLTQRALGQAKPYYGEMLLFVAAPELAKEIRSRTKVTIDI